jgi:hypothetical protein
MRDPIRPPLPSSHAQGAIGLRDLDVITAVTLPMVGAAAPVNIVLLAVERRIRARF